MEQPADDDDYNKQIQPIPEKCGPPSIPLSMLLDFAVQQIFHEITVMSELLLKKYEEEKKISLVQFAHNTRTLTVKLLAIVKWVKSSKKFENCSIINYILDQQAQYFIDTADRLVFFSRQELEVAKLPTFQVCSAVDILTQGTYPRLPLCIKQRFIREPKITPKEQANALSRINKILRYRISRVASKLPPKFRQIHIKNGMLTLVVPSEFEVKMTVLGEAETLPWTLLNIKILVEDYEIGYGTQLVHPLQLNLVHNVLQSRMDISKNPLNEVYTFLHSFAQSLKLDVLFCQSTQLANGKLRDKILIERYDQKERILTVGYWAQKLPTKRGQIPRYNAQFRFQISCDREDSRSSLRVRHYPPNQELGGLDERSGRLSIHSLLSDVFAFRSRQRLLKIRQKLEESSTSASVLVSGQEIPLLIYRLLDKSTPEEMLKISVNLFSGRVICVVDGLGEVQELRNLEKCLDPISPIQSIKKHIDRLKVLTMIERYRKAVSSLLVRIVSETQMASKLSKITSLPADRLILQFYKDDSFYLIVSFVVDPQLIVKTELHLLSVNDDQLTLLHLSRDHPGLVAPMTRFLYANKDEELRKGDHYGRRLTCAIAAVDDRISFMKLCEELDRRNIQYDPLETEPVVGGLVLRLKNVQAAVDTEAPEFFDNLVRCCLRLDSRTRIGWPFECCIKNNPLPLDCLPGKPGPNTRACVLDVSLSSSSGPPGINPSDSLSTAIVERLQIFVNIYKLVHEFAPVYKKVYKNVCSIQAYTYHKLIIAYGEKRDQLMVISFRPNLKSSEPKRFCITFNQTVPTDAYTEDDFQWPEEGRWNPHTQLSPIINEKFNANPDLVELVEYVVSTSAPLCALSKFLRIRFQSVKALAQILNHDMAFPLEMKYYLFAIDDYTMRLQYGHIFLEFRFLQDSQVGIRDCSRFQPAVVGLEQFWKWISGGSAQLCTNSNVSHASPHAPTSLPSQHVAAASPPPSSTQSLSVPPSSTNQSPHSQGTSFTTSGSGLTLTPNIILVDHVTLHKACQPPESALRRPLVPTKENNAEFANNLSPLDSYLSAIEFVYRTGAAFKEIYSLPLPQQPVHFEKLDVQPDSIRASVLSIRTQSAYGQNYPCIVNFQFFVCPNTFTVKCSVEYDGLGDSGPKAEQISIIESYFDYYISRFNNEYALVAFINLCRMTPNGALFSIIKIMRGQLYGYDEDPLTNIYWNMSIMPTMLQRKPDQSGGAHGSQSTMSARKFRPGVLLDRNQTMRIHVNFCPLSPDESDKMRRHMMWLQYNVQTNQVEQVNQGMSDEKEILTNIFAAANEMARQSNECPLWEVVSQLLQRPELNRMPSSVPMPNSMMGPGSVDNIGSVGQIPSVGNMGSVGTSGSVHNPLLKGEPGMY
ncbi:unnamed protein product, partial [Mesorhabditis belari]|uniref:Mediator of RNA polymerase II transcription subunit 14 n=1 Tax=Mesorhabditis belari TaxID=2138241 RepID=A0AAF3FBG1_9BILA